MSLLKKKLNNKNKHLLLNFFENKLRIKNNSGNKFIVKKFIFSSNDIKNTIKIEKKYN